LRFPKIYKRRETRVRCKFLPWRGLLGPQLLPEIEFYDATWGHRSELAGLGGTAYVAEEVLVDRQSVLRPANQRVVNQSAHAAQPERPARRLPVGINEFADGSVLFKTDARAMPEVTVFEQLLSMVAHHQDHRLRPGAGLVQLGQHPGQHSIQIARGIPIRPPQPIAVPRHDLAARDRRIGQRGGRTPIVIREVHLLPIEIGEERAPVIDAPKPSPKTISIWPREIGGLASGVGAPK